MKEKGKEREGEGEDGGRREKGKEKMEEGESKVRSLMWYSFN